MRHYGKEGAQCRVNLDPNKGTAETCHMMARSVLFGRVPRRFVLWLGMGVMLASLVLGIFCISSLKPTSNYYQRDAASSLLIRR